MDSKASARWEGGLKDGQGNVATESGALDAGYSFKQRFEGAPGTTPEELIGAAHASCFSMALSMILGEKGFTADAIDTNARVTLSQSADGFDISSIHLDVVASVSGADDAAFQEAAETAKANCPVSKVLNADITMDATLKG
ncbi:MAG: OsmC family protein [Vreelandella alkaliphila]|uniref:OsmC family peroxiredoxin n=2 Tax=Halomonadaceae TaxID=28256 RepID=A0A060B836_9GAMM|nr:MULTISPECIES: OsmC family protein [Halomonas]AIA75359.1 peroxiredoxin OsmC [Halomonas campaniensis]ASK19508.1 OsmC family peroxiredoxin [Halomonas sp. N3-2A]AYF32503.1 OsmC family peroxiredoxin [Halomonas alkaliphila]MCD6004300.1 OsmC family protein [Halomonas sp. IOP_6]MCD6439788.1 OsmC family protein [Halomonas sp.]